MWLTPLNPEALDPIFAVAMMEVLDAEKMQSGNFLVHVNDIREVLERLQEKILAVTQPLVTSLEELDSMSDGSIVKDSEGEVYIMTPTMSSGECGEMIIVSLQVRLSSPPVY